MRTRTDIEPTVDHGVIVGASLEELTAAFEAIDLEPVYAGPLENELNHLSQVAFPDGSYFELLSTIEDDQQSPWWNDHLKRNGGPCAWAVESAAIEADADRASSAGLRVEGPTRYGRERPNGTYFDYELAIVGEGGIATTFPFLIQDHTPRSKRVQWPSPCAEGTALTGIRFVLTAVDDLDARVRVFREAYGVDAPDRSTVTRLTAEVAAFPGSPIVLAEPTGANSWLRDRLDTHGERPAAYLLGTTDFPETVDRFGLAVDDDFLGRPCAWFHDPKLEAINTRIGVVGQRPD